MVDYKELYEQALEKAKEIHRNEDEKKHDMEWLFPELKESEDERIRENIIATIHLYYGEPLEEEAQEMIAWLEKQNLSNRYIIGVDLGDPAGDKGNSHAIPPQGEQKPPIEMKTAEESLGCTSEEYNNIVDECVFGDNKPKFKVGDWITIKE